MAPGGYFNRRGKWYDVLRCYTVAPNFWEEATPAMWAWKGRYFWPAKGVSLRKLKPYERDALAFNYDYEDSEDW